MNRKRLFGLIGHPLSHSFSYRYFNEKFEKNNIDAEYRNFDCPHLPDLDSLVAENSTLSGLNVTIPYKSRIMDSLHEIDGEAKNIKAVNVIQFKNGRYKGYNTDYIAFMQSISPLIKPESSSALILGSGGASKAIKYALEKWHIPYSVVSRNGSDEGYAYEDLNRDVILDFNVIINATPLGAYPNVEEAPDIPYEALTEDHVLYDLTYNPELTSFLKKGMEKNCRTKNGYDMLVRQAELSWEIWNDSK